MRSRMVAGLRTERKKLETKHQRLQGVQRKLREKWNGGGKAQWHVVSLRKQ